VNRLNSIGFGVAIALVAVAALAFSRPGNEQQMIQLLNGQETRWVMADGGSSGMFGSGISCMPLAEIPAAANGVIELVPLYPINLCYVNVNALPRWDGGCGLNAGDINLGLPLQPLVPKWVSLKTSTTHLCQVSDAGTAVTPVFSMQ
jgi:hypothetical protein